jgi:uncharacterized protein (TIGR02679 family)
MTRQVQQLERLLGGPALARLLDVLEERVRRGRSLSGTITVSGVGAEERAVIAALFGRSPGSGASMVVDLDALDRVVRESGAESSLRAAVERLRGPLVVRAEQVRAERLAWAGAEAVLEDLAHRRPEYAEWVSLLRSRGTVRRLAGTPELADAIVARVAQVLDALPAEREARGRFAARVLGSAHALDVGRPEATLVLSALNGGRPVGGAADRRSLWEGVGIAVDELSSTVLVHALPLRGPVGELTAAGEPVVLTLRQLQGLGRIASASPVFVCENPAVVDAAARELGATAPLICVLGRPSLAAMQLLREVAAAGLRYHGDFDWGGIRIANSLHQTFGFEPWRYGSRDLEDAALLPGAPLKGSPIAARWDPTLQAALERRGSRLEEEQVLDILLADLSTSR